jgi:hypothetical protein
MSKTLETLAEEFSRLVREYRKDPDSMEGAEAWNLISEFAVDNADCISAALQSAADTPSATWERDEPVGYVTKGELTLLLGGASCVDLFGRVVPKGVEMVPLYEHPEPREDGL